MLARTESKDDEEEEEETTLIDTSEPALGRTESQALFDSVERDIEQITQRIIEKAEFLLRLSTPEAWEQDRQAPGDNEVVLMRTTSDIADQRHQLLVGEKSGANAQQDVELDEEALAQRQEQQ